MMFHVATDSPKMFQLWTRRTSALFASCAYIVPVVPFPGYWLWYLQDRGDEQQGGGRAGGGAIGEEGRAASMAERQDVEFTCRTAAP